MTRSPRIKRTQPPFTPDLLGDVRALIEQARARVAASVSHQLATLYYGIGRRIHQDLLGQAKAEYGQRIVENLSARLTEAYGQGFSRANLFHMVRFAEVFPDEETVYTLCRQLSWSHLRTLIYLDDPLKRSFYTEMCRLERWSVRTLQDRIHGLLFERTAISRRPAALAQKELDTLREAESISPDLVFRDPYLLDFLGLADTWSERDLEAAILRDLEQYILELGTDFSFVGRQKRMTVDGEDYYLDLLFFHRKLRCLVAIDLKLGRFQAADKGQMELYLTCSWTGRTAAGGGRTRSPTRSPSRTSTARRCSASSMPLAPWGDSWGPWGATCPTCSIGSGSGRTVRSGGPDRSKVS